MTANLPQKPTFSRRVLDALSVNHSGRRWEHLITALLQRLELSETTMFERIIRVAIEQRWLVMLVVIAMAGLGIYNYQRLPIDAVPDITNVQVQINTQLPGYSPLEAEQRATYPIETVMAGLPNLQQTRSLSRYGLSQVTVIFKDGTDIYFARQLVNERIQGQREPDELGGIGLRHHH